MRKTLSIILAILLLTLAAAGCGGTVPAASGSPATVSGAASDTVSPSDAPSSAAASPETSAASQEAASASATATPEPATAEPVAIRIGGLTGPTSMGLVGVMEAARNGTSANSYEFTVAGSADELTPRLIQGDLDMAAVPANLAAVLYNNTKGKIRLLAVNTLGVLYIVEKGDSVGQIADLKGKTIYATGKGSSPEYALRYLLSENGIDPDKDVTIEWKAEPAEVVALLKQDKGGIAMLPQPYVTIAGTQVEGLRTALDLTKEWDALGNGSRMVTGVLAVRADFAGAHPEAVSAFLDEYRASIDFVNADVEKASALIETFGIFKAAVAKKALPACNITFLAGADMKAAMQGYLQVLFDQNPKAVGGTLPGDEFYLAVP